MKIKKTAALTLATLLGACGGAGAGAGPAPDGALTVRMPAAPSARFVKADTSVVTVDAPGIGTFDLDVKAEATVSVAFTEAPNGLKATATYQALSGSMTNPMGAPLNVDESAVTGQLVFTVDGRGRTTVTESLGVDLEAVQLVSPSGFAYELFPRLPDRTVSVGDSWIDTITVNEDAEGITSETIAIVTYTVAGDTTVGGRSLMKLNTDSDIEASVSGTMQGMSMSQNMSGSGSGWVLWDAAMSLVHSSFSVGDLAGLMSIDAPGAPDMSLTVSSRSYTKRAAN